MVTLTTIQANALTRWAGVDGRDTATKARDILVAAITEAQKKGEIPDAPKAVQPADALLRSTLQRLAAGIDIDPIELAAIAHDTDMDVATLEKIRTCLKGESNGHAVSEQS